MTDYLNNERVKAARSLLQQTMLAEDNAYAAEVHDAIDALCATVVAAVSGPARPPEGETVMLLECGNCKHTVASHFLAPNTFCEVEGCACHKFVPVYRALPAARPLVDALTLIAQRTVHDTHIEGVDSCSVCIAQRALAESAGDGRELRQANERGDTPADRTSGEGASGHAPASAPDPDGIAARPQGTAVGEWRWVRILPAQERPPLVLEDDIGASPPSPGVSPPAPREVTEGMVEAACRAWKKSVDEQIAPSVATIPATSLITLETCVRAALTAALSAVPAPVAPHCPICGGLGLVEDGKSVDVNGHESMSLCVCGDGTLDGAAAGFERSAKEAWARVRELEKQLAAVLALSPAAGSGGTQTAGTTRPTTESWGPSIGVLKPCPFCGEEAEVWISNRGDDGSGLGYDDVRWYIKCGNEDCAAEVGNRSSHIPGSAEDLWNRRALFAPVPRDWRASAEVTETRQELTVAIVGWANHQRKQFPTAEALFAAMDANDQSVRDAIDKCFDAVARCSPAEQEKA